MQEVQHSFEWSNFLIWLWSGIVAVSVWLFKLFIGHRDEKMANMIAKSLATFMQEIDKKYTRRELCEASHKLTDQNLLSLRSKLETLESKLDLILEKLL